MSQRTAAQAEKKPTMPLASGRLQHAAVRPVPEHGIAPVAQRESSFGHDFSRVPAHTVPTASQAERSAAGSVFPRTRPFGGEHHAWPVQAKLTINKPGDKYEREADQVADTVLHMPEPLISRGATVGKGIQQLPIQRLQSQPYQGLQRQPVEEMPEEEEEEEKETGLAKLQAKETPGQTPDAPSGLQTRLQSIEGGRTLSPPVRTFFEPRFGHDFSQVRVHTGSEAARTARELNARAFTRGQNIYLGSGQYRPGTSAGRKLLAHELTHTIQQGEGAPDKTPASLAQSSLTISHGSDPLEHEAKTVAGRVVTGRSIPPGAITTGPNNAQPMIARAESGTAPPAADQATTAPPATDQVATAEVNPPTEPVSLAGSGTFTPTPAWTAYLESRGKDGAAVPVRFGNLARGRITLLKSADGYATTGTRHQAIPLVHSALQPIREAGIEPVLAVRIRESAIRGYATIASDQGAARNASELVDWIKNHATEMGWLGLDVSDIPNVTNELQDGVLRLQLTDFPFRLGGFMNGTGNFGLTNETVTFGANATVRVPNLTEAQLELERGEQGGLSGQVEVPVSIANFSGNLLAQYGNGTVNIEGTIGYSAEKFNGEITLLVTDRDTARNVAHRRQSPEQIAASGEQAAGEGEAESGPRRGPRAVAGFGTLNFAFTEWMTGQAEVIIDNVGHITVVGEIAPPAEVELFPQRDYIKDLFTLEVRTLYGVPLVGNVFLFANIGLQAMAKLGPGKIYNIAARGVYSTDSEVLQNYELEATLNISAFAGLRLRAEGGAGVELLGHDIKAGVGIVALAGIRGYVEATPTIGYRETADPQEGRQGEYFIKGHMEIAAQPFLGLGGDLFIELDSPWWSPAPDKKWTWPLGELEYPLPGEFGIGADVDYVVGSDELPEIEFGEVDFNKDKFMTDLMNDHVPPKSQGEQEQQGEWQEGETTGEAAAEPTLTDSAGAPAQEPARGRREAGEGEAPAPQVQQPWLQGLRALGGLAQESQTAPLDRRALDARLNQLRQQYGFTGFRVESVGKDWAIYPRMNPEPSEPVRVEGQESTEGAQEETLPQSDAPSGKTKSDPIEMIWYKPLGLYPPSIQLGEDRYFINEPDPLVVPSVAGLPDVRRSGATSGEIVIGIDPTGEFYPGLDKVWPRVRAGVLRTGDKQREFRHLLREYGYDWGSKEADHVRDLQWAGEDAYDNLWPLERTWNNLANRILGQSVTYKNDSGEVETVPLRDTPLNRWFIIKGMQRP